MQFTFNRLCSLSDLDGDEYKKELTQLLAIIRTASVPELEHIEHILTGYMDRGKWVLNDALWERKTAIQHKRNTQKTHFWAFLKWKPICFENQNDKNRVYQREVRPKVITKNNFHQLPDAQDQNSLFQDPDTQLQFQIPS